MIYLASDHGGYNVKEQIKLILKAHHVAHTDLGPDSLETNDDYPDYVLPLAETVARSGGKGIVSCRNGQGVAIAANKVAGVRAAVCWDENCARTSRHDDDTNVLSIPADYLAPQEVEAIVNAWLKTPFSYEKRHQRRIAKIHEYEERPK
jgi:ribose 5-phosphate isomerase B